MSVILYFGVNYSCLFVLFDVGWGGFIVVC